MQPKLALVLASLVVPIADCLGCAPELEPVGVEIVALGFVVTAVTALPFGIVHWLLRRSGR